jgi:hypothetical protein
MFQCCKVLSPFENPAQFRSAAFVGQTVEDFVFCNCQGINNKSERLGFSSCLLAAAAPAVNDITFAHFLVLPLQRKYGYGLL